MISKFFDGLGGVITLRVKGKNQERMINLASSRGIYIWDIKWQGNKLRLRIRSSALEAFQAIAEENNFELEIVARKGLPFFKTKLQKRIGFLSGAAVFVLALYVLSWFVWFVEVDGNKEVPTRQILASAARHGLHQGGGKWNFSANDVENAMLRELPRLTYVQCDIQGVKARIKVVEKVWPEENYYGPCHITASRDGVIDEILVLEGQAAVKPGQVVARGDILISGIVYPTTSETITERENILPQDPFLVRARGIVKARTWYDGYGECPRRVETKVMTGKTVLGLDLQTPWKVLHIKKAGLSRARTYKPEERRLTADTRLGAWGIFISRYHEQKTVVKEYSEAQAIEIAQEKGFNNLRKKIRPDVEISDSRIEVLSAPSDAMVRIKVAIESIEDISKVQPIE